MLNLKFVILSSLSAMLTSLTASTVMSKRKQALKCKEKQLKVFCKANKAVAEAQQLVEVDTFNLEQARAEAIARVNMEYDNKIAGLQVSVDEAQEYADKQFVKVAKYDEEISK